MKGDGIGSSLVLVVRQEAGRYVGGEIIGVPTPLEAAYQGYTEGVKAGSD